MTCVFLSIGELCLSISINVLRVLRHFWIPMIRKFTQTFL